MQFSRQVAGNERNKQTNNSACLLTAAAAAAGNRDTSFDCSINSCHGDHQTKAENILPTVKNRALQHQQTHNSVYVKGRSMLDWTWRTRRF